MSDQDPHRPGGRRPIALSLDAGKAAPPPAGRRAPRQFETVREVPDAEDVFEAAVLAAPPPVPRPKRSFSFARLGFGAVAALVSLAIGLWTDSLIRDLFARADWLGYTALGLVVLALVSIAAAALREVIGIRRMEAAQGLKDEALLARAEPSPKPARAVIARLSVLLAARPETARGRETLTAAEDDIIDGPHLIDLGERVLLGPLDLKARALILGASKRVSVVTAVSPRAIVDLVYVLYEASRLVRAVAEIYGHRPSRLGMIRLFRKVLAHLAVTGTIAVGDSLAQQVLGHGLASRLSARLGEGVINGLMTARIGIAAMDYCRPLPFTALKRPGIGDFLSDLTPSLGAGRRPDPA